MTAIRLLLAVIWLAFGLGATANAGTIQPCEMAGMRHHACHSDDATPVAMPCCSQPVVIAEQVALPQSWKCVQIRFLPARAAEPVCAAFRIEPRPPKAA